MEMDDQDGKTSGVDKELMEQAAKAEELAASIMIKKRELIDSDRRRQQNVEALAHLRHRRKSQSGSAVNQVTLKEKQYMCVGPLFVKLPSSQIEVLLKEDQKNLDKVINETRSEMKVEMLQLHRIRPSALNDSYLKFALGNSTKDHNAS